MRSIRLPMWFPSPYEVCRKINQSLPLGMPTLLHSVPLEAPILLRPIGYPIGYRGTETQSRNLLIRDKACICLTYANHGFSTICVNLRIVGLIRQPPIREGLGVREW